MRVLFADSVVGSTITELEARGHTCVVEPKLKAADLAGSVGGYDAGGIGPTAEGIVAFIFGLAAMVGIAIWLGAKA